jgi:hypothetical protein
MCFVIDHQNPLRGLDIFHVQRDAVVREARLGYFDGVLGNRATLFIFLTAT